MLPSADDINMSPWTFCNTIVPEYKDLVHLADILNYSKRRMWAILNEPYGNGYDDDSAEEAIENYIQKIDRLSNEYIRMVELHYGHGRIA